MVLKCEIFFMVLAFGFSFSNSQKCDSTPDFCANPVVETENKIDVKWLHEHYTEGRNVQFANSVARRRLAQIAVGKKLPRDVDYTDVCLRFGFDFVDQGTIVGFISAYGNQTVKYKCTDDENHIYHCIMENQDTGLKDTAIIYLTYFDGQDENHNLAGLALCYPDGDVGWHFSTVSKTISEEETKTMTDRLKSIGLNPDLKIQTYSDTCA